MGARAEGAGDATGDERPQARLRIVSFNVHPVGFGLVARWAEAHGHRLALVVTTPGPSSRRTPTYQEVVALAPPGLDVLVTTRPRRVAAPLIRALRPDLIISASFPYRIPPEITEVPRLGAVNLHPAPLPAWRGPNIQRPIYEGWPELGVTLHRTAEEFDTGPILSRHTAPLPADVSPEAVMAAWLPLFQRALDDGMAAAIRGEPGIPQDDARASYAAPFTEDEHWLDWQEPAAVLRRKVTALNLFGPPSAKAHIEGAPFLVHSLMQADDGSPSPPGIVLRRDGDGMLIGAGDGSVRVAATPLTA